MTAFSVNISSGSWRFELTRLLRKCCSFASIDLGMLWGSSLLEGP